LKTHNKNNTNQRSRQFANCRMNKNNSAKKKKRKRKLLVKFLFCQTMSDEDLQRNVFWLALNSKTHAALYHSVAQHRLIVCVPVQASMPTHVVLDKYYLGASRPASRRLDVH
jgi:hypothetical protein